MILKRILKTIMMPTYSGIDETRLLKHLKEQGLDFEIVMVEDRYFVKTGVDTPKPKILTE